MKPATIFTLFSTIRAAALFTDDIGSGANVEALATETLDLLELTETTKDNKVVNFRDNVMKVTEFAFKSGVKHKSGVASNQRLTALSENNCKATSAKG